jgi:hypothetical protein
MAVVPVQCPRCQGIHVVKYAKQANSTQPYRCNDLAGHRSPHRADVSIRDGQPCGPRLLGPPGAVETPWYDTRYYTDKGGAYRRYLPPEQHVIGKRPMQKIERRDQLN